MAKRTSSGGGAGGQAGEVFVRLRADLGQLDADLKTAARQVDSFAAGGGAGSVADSYKSRFDKQDLAMAAREARRGQREQLATIKDQLADTSAFSGAGFADALFGIDNDRIRATKLSGTIGDLKGNISKLREEHTQLTSAYKAGAMSQTDYAAASAAVRNRVTDLIGQTRPLQGELDGIQRKWSGVGGAIRGAGATIASSLASSLLIGAGIGIATTAIQGLVEVGGDIVDRLVNPTERAAKAFDQLGAAISKAGGSEAFIKFYNLTGNLADLARQAAAAAEAKPDFKSAGDILAASGATIAYGAGGANKADRDAALKEFSKEFFVELGPLKMADPGKLNSIIDGSVNRRIKEQFGQEGLDRFGGALLRDPALMLTNPTQALTNAFNALGSVVIEETVAAGAKSRADEKAAKTAEERAKADAAAGAKMFSDAISAAKAWRDVSEAAAQSAAKLRETEQQRAMLLNNDKDPSLTAAMRNVVLANKGLEGAQGALDKYQKAISARGLRDQLGDARADVARASVATPGMSPYELAASILEARQRQRDVERQVAEQRKMTNLQDRVAQQTTRVANAQRALQLETMDANIAALKRNLTPEKLSQAFSEKLAGMGVYIDGTVAGTVTEPTVTRIQNEAGRFGLATK